MENNCPYLMFKGDNPNFLSSIPVHVTKNNGGGCILLDCMNEPVCIKDQTIEAGLNCMYDRYLNCSVFNK